MAPGRINVGILDVRNLDRYWRLVDEFERQLEQQQEARPGLELTARKFDEAQPAGPRVYIGAYAQILGGSEHSHALRALLLHDGATPRVPWTLLRSVFEAGFWGTWLLEPGEGAERRRRGLRLEVRDMKQRALFRDSLSLADPKVRSSRAAGSARSTKTYHEEAQQLNMTWAITCQAPNIVDEIPKLGMVRGLDTESRGFVVAIWRLLSGMQHGYSYAIITNSDVTGRVEIPGGQQVTVSVNDNALHAAAVTSYWLLITAAQLYLERSRRA
jgi:hypothetical protein